ncbi:polymer-forming cytoskeletal protein [Thermodesulfobacteriota bacterium]
MKSKEISAFLNKDTEFEGKLKFSGTIRIDGHIKGEISAKG